MASTNEIERAAQQREARRLWGVIENIAAEVEARVAQGPDPVVGSIEHRERLARLHRGFWELFG